MGFIHEDFLLGTKTARRLYHEYAEGEPILDFHNHLPPADISSDRKFLNLHEIWLEGDHYKWRAMRANGIAERYCTGDAAPIEKFQAWARTVPHTLRNPLYHWTHLELKRYFGIDELLDERNARKIWDRAGEILASGELSARRIVRRFRVQVLCTTDDPCSDLAEHKKIAESETAFRVYPAFRPDKAMTVHSPQAFNEWVDRLAAVSNVHIVKLADFLRAIELRHDYFHAMGARLSDHGIDTCFADFPTEAEAARIFERARAGQAATPDEHRKFASFLMLFFGHLDAKKGWTKQLHLGALRNASSRGQRLLGPDTGFDSIGDWNQAEALCAYLDRLERENALPKTIVYNLNPADNYVFATAVGNFQDGSIAGKMQLGSGWWYLDQKEAIEWQLNALSNVGLLSRFVGMLTDSRSFMSYPRHEYFRRVLCNLIGRDVEAGELPDDNSLLGPMIRNICFGNARDYLGLELPSAAVQREKVEAR
ncbi:MAG: glucuronate isomerase [Candidatus Acidiferrales bacterium]|jgi:glucuronate isomerase